MVGKDFQNSKHKRIMKEKIDKLMLYLYIIYTILGIYKI